MQHVPSGIALYLTLATDAVRILRHVTGSPSGTAGDIVKFTSAYYSTTKAEESCTLQMENG